MRMGGALLASACAIAALGMATPHTTFGAGLKVWHDVWDPDTVFADFAGTPATLGSRVALVLDKSLWNGRTRAQELAQQPELVTNGDFSDGLAGWTAAPVSGSVGNGIISQSSGGGIRVTNDASGFNFGLASQAINCVPGCLYKVTLSRGATSSGSLAFWYVGDAPNGNQATAVAANITTNTRYFLATKATHYINLGAYVNVANGWAEWDNISVKALPGPHMAQASTAQQPFYGRVPRGGRRNLLTYTDPDAVVPTGWTDFNAAPPGKSFAALSNGISGLRFQSSGNRPRISQSSVTVTAGQTFTATVYVEPGYTAPPPSLSGNDVLRLFVSGGADIRASLGQEDENGRLTLVYTATVGGVLVFQYGPGIDGPVTGHDVVMGGAQLETGSTATAYQKVLQPYDVTEAGVPSVPCLYSDGVDDGMVTPPLDLTGTDKLAVFTAVEKMSDTASSNIVELSASLDANNGTFHIRGPRTATNNYSFASKGTSLAEAIAAGFAAPNSAVLTALGNIGSDSAILRVNGAQVAQSTADQGTGNYGNYPLYYFRRGGVSIPFGGYWFGDMLFAGAPSPAQIAWAENHYNKQVGAYS